MCVMYTLRKEMKRKGIIIKSNIKCVQCTCNMSKYEINKKQQYRKKMLKNKIMTMKGGEMYVTYL